MARHLVSTVESLPSLPAFDLERVTHELSTSFNPLHTEFRLSYQVIESRDGFNLVTLALPDGMTRAFITFLESMALVFRSIDVKSKSAQAQAKIHDPEEIGKREQNHAEFVQVVCSLFDQFTSQGCTVNEAVKRTNSTLKAQSHPWACYDTVLNVLRKERRFRRRKGGES